MNRKDIFDFINSINTIRNNNESFIKLKCFFNAMMRNQYYYISDDEIKEGVDYLKVEMKALLKASGLPKQQEMIEEINIDSTCKQFQSDLLNYKRRYENQNNHVIKA